MISQEAVTGERSKKTRREEVDRVRNPDASYSGGDDSGEYDAAGIPPASRRRGGGDGGPVRGSVPGGRPRTGTAPGPPAPGGARGPCLPGGSQRRGRRPPGPARQQQR